MSHAVISLLHTCTHAVPCSISHGKSNFYLCKYKFTYDETWALDLATCDSLHNARLSRGSMLSENKVDVERLSLLCNLRE